MQMVRGKLIQWFFGMVVLMEGRLAVIAFTCVCVNLQRGIINADGANVLHHRQLTTVLIGLPVQNLNKKNMTKHYKIYAKYFDYATPDEIPCEACGRPAVDIHHINGRGKGKDIIENLMALCRRCHEKAHNGISKEAMQLIHNYFLNGQRKQFFK